MIRKTHFFYLLIIHVKSRTTNRLKSHHLKNKNFQLQISQMKHFGDLNHGNHINDIKMNHLDHEGAKGSIVIV
jgi:hypothetical protein